MKLCHEFGIHFLESKKFISSYNALSKAIIFIKNSIKYYFINILVDTSLLNMASQFLSSQGIDKNSLIGSLSLKFKVMN